MNAKRGRCLWLMNHRTLRAFEVPMLVEMGFEVFCPKMFPYDEGNLSADITYEFDSTLSVPEEVLDRINQIDFYKGVTKDILEIINKYFDIAFIGFFPKQLKMLVEGFRGVIVMQPFGLSNGLTYTRVISDELGVNFLDKIENLGKRFIFGQSYENIAEIECRILKNRAMYLPLGLKDAYVKDEWEGGDKRILFVCPRINTSPYFKNIYTTFKKNFEGFDYLIGGAQPIQVRNDEKVAGFIPNEQYAYNMKHLSVMFYHSQEERHVHYHPFEAVKKGMPLIFMAGGILDRMGGDKLPGRCETIKEARKKIKKIMNGDRSFIEKVKKNQGILLKKFTYEYCRNKWNENIDFIQAQIEEVKKERNCDSQLYKKKKKIAVLLPEGYLGGVLDTTTRFIYGLQRGLEEANANAEIIFGYLDHKNFEEDTFHEIEEMGIQIRPFKWKFLTREDIKNVYKIRNYDLPVNHKKYCVADDGINCFEDCDHIIFIIDRVGGYFYSNKPYSVIVQDYIQRYLPGLMVKEAESVILDLQRKAEAVYVTTLPAKSDCIQYAGISEEKIKLIPLLLEKTVVEKDEPISDRYFLWSTNIGEHKNHMVMLKALEQYYKQGGKLKCYMTGINTELFNVKKKIKKETKYIKQIRDFISKSKALSKNIVIKGNMDKKEYYNILSKAKFLVHPGYTDNGNMSSVDAAFLGVPSISSDYPPMRYYEDVMKLGIHFVSPFDYNEWVDILLEAEKDYKEWKRQMPTVAEMDKISIHNVYRDLYEVVSEVVGL